jgi:hypothetical protein
MDWITTVAHQRDSEKERTRLFDREVNELWASLKARMNACCESYERLYRHDPCGILAQFDETNAEAPFVKCVKQNPADQLFSQEKCRVTLSRNGAVYVAVYSTSRPELLLTVVQADDGHAVVQYDSTDVSLDRASELILRPILFDDVPEDL